MTPSWLPGLAAAAPLLLLAVLRTRRRDALELADARALRGAGRRFRLLRAGLVLAAAVALGGVAAAAGRPGGAAGGLVGSEGDTVVVLDMSASVSDLVYREIARTLRVVIGAGEEDRRVGLVLFSDTAQVALPPGTPAAELEPFLAFFQPKARRATEGRPVFFRDLGPGAPAPTQYPLSPWFGTFSGGTRISTGLAAAREALAGAGGGRVVLVSDLAPARSDVPRLLRELTAYRQAGLDLRVVALPPATERDKALYRSRGTEALVDSDALAPAASSGGVDGSPFPRLLVLAVALVGVAVALHAARAAPLRWGSAP